MSGKMEETMERNGEWTNCPVPVLVEARMRKTCELDISALEKQVSNLVAAQPTLRDGDLSCDEELSKSIVSVRVCGITSSSDPAQIKEVKEAKDEEEVDVQVAPVVTLPFWRVAPKIALYYCADDKTKPEEDEESELPSIPFSIVHQVPSGKLDKIWDSLQFGASDIKSRLLSYLSSAAFFRKRQVDASVVNWHGIALLHGPPGTGKTSLCKALAHKIAIRNGGGIAGRRCYLVEVRAEALYSKFFGESARNVGNLFTAVGHLAQDAEHIFVLLDEVESLALARGASTSEDGQPSDGMRSVNSLLTSLDALRDAPNVTILATSNLITRIDPAFLDRVDVHERIPEPGLSARLRIIAETVEELTRAGAVVAPDKSLNNAGKIAAREQFDRLVLEVARAAIGLSGRTLRKLPLLAHAAHARGSTKAVRTTSFLHALKVQAMKARKNRS